MSSWGNNSSKRNCKKGRGQQKVEMAKIQNASNLQVTFSKRRGGLFKKASELSTLCAAETAVVVFSPGGKPHSFGHPDVETVCSRFLSQPQNVLEANAGGGGGGGLLEAHQRANISPQTLELNRLQQQVEVEREWARELDRRRRRWCGPGLGYAELARLEEAVLRFKDQFEEDARVCVDGGAGFGPATYLPGCGFRGGGPAECEMMGGESSILIPYSSPPPTPAHN